MAKIGKPDMNILSRAFRQPEGYPDTTTVNQRVGAAVARLQVRGVVPQPNPLVTAWQVQALLLLLFRKGLIDQADVDEFKYLTAYEQMKDLERLVDERPVSPLIVPAAAGPRAVQKDGN
mgnify:CR=1 FL=1